MSYCVDFAADGRPNIKGNLRIVRDLEALNNAIKLWLGSFRGERLYLPTKGGVLLPYLMKPMSEAVANRMKEGLREGLRYDFEPSVIVRRSEVVPEYENSWYRVMIVGFCPLLNSDVYYNDTINSLRV